MKTFLTASMLQFFNTSCLGITKHLTSLKPVLMFSLMLQGNIETNDWFQMVGRIRGARESRVWSPSLNSLFLHSLIYLLLENMHAPCSLSLPHVGLSGRLFGWLSWGYSGAPVWLPTAGTSNIKFATQGVGTSGCGTFWKWDCLFIRPNIETRCLY